MRPLWSLLALLAVGCDARIETASPGMSGVPIEGSAACCGGSCRPCRQSVASVGVYPAGARFALALLATDFGATPAMAEASACGWNIEHTYYEPWRDTQGVSLAFMQAGADAGFAILTSLNSTGTPASPLDEITMSNAIAARAATGQVAFWDLPEEMRYWYPTEMSVVASYAAWTRAYDPRQSPNIMYIPGHYGGAAVQNYVPYLDVVPSSCYANYYGQPHAWTRWRMETTVQAIRDAGYSLGPDYLRGSKTPAAYLELYTGSTSLTPEGSYHDFWQSIVSGARVILIYSFAYKDSTPQLAASWQSLCEAARRLTGPEDLEEAILYGTPLGAVTAEVLSGPARTPIFTPYGTAPIDYESLDLLAVRFDGEVFVIVVNSAEQQVTARLAGLPAASSADVLFEARTVTVVGGALEDSFAPLGVHIYRVVEPLPSMTSSSSTVAPGAAISVVVANAPGFAKDWVGLYVKDEETHFLAGGQAPLAPDDGFGGVR